MSLVFDASNTTAVRTVETVNVGNAAGEGHASGVRTTNRT